MNKRNRERNHLRNFIKYITDIYIITYYNLYNSLNKDVESKNEIKLCFFKLKIQAKITTPKIILFEIIERETYIEFEQ